MPSVLSRLVPASCWVTLCLGGASYLLYRTTQQEDGMTPVMLQKSKGRN